MAWTLHWPAGVSLKDQFPWENSKKREEGERGKKVRQEVSSSLQTPFRGNIKTFGPRLVWPVSFCSTQKTFLAVSLVTACLFPLRGKDMHGSLRIECHPRARAHSNILIFPKGSHARLDIKCLFPLPPSYFSDHCKFMHKENKNSNVLSLSYKRPCWTSYPSSNIPATEEKRQHYKVIMKS